MATRSCSIEGCDKVHYGRDWCSTHYQRWLKHGDPLAYVRGFDERERHKVCSVAGCDVKHYGQGMCRVHLRRFKVHGDPSVVVTPAQQHRTYRPDDVVLAKLLARIVKQPNGCWEWQAGKDGRGYGRISYRARNWGAHRVAYTLLVGVIPEGLDLCHACDNPPCINPAHLFPATHAENVADMRAKGRGRVRWTVADVQAMRAAFAAGESPASIARRFGTAQTAVSRIVKREAWTHVA